MGKALYREYRPKKLSEVVGQEHVTTTLSNALKQGRISHAYLLTGPRGVGKTSVARILAHDINGLPYDDEAHLDIIEIDAASNRRIDEIRDLRDRITTAPSAAKYKVYIIDEVHMLTKEAFNALLKTLEEPPAHVVFILATTEAHKLPDTIVSRTQRYTFRPVPAEQIAAHLKTIAEAEKMLIDDDALALIAEHGDGSFRDSISLLDQASSSGESVTRAGVARILGLAPDEQLDGLQAAVTADDRPGIVTGLSSMYAAGYEPAMIAQQLSARLRQNVLAGTASADTLTLLKQLLEVAASRSPRQFLELTLLQAAIGAPTSSAATVEPVAKTAPAVAKGPKIEKAEKEALPGKDEAPIRAVESKTSMSNQQNSTEREASASEKGHHDEKEAIAQSDEAEASQHTAGLTELWQQALDEIKHQHNTLYGIARMATPELDGDTLTLKFRFAFHQKRINEAKNRKLFADVVERLRGRPVQITCVVAEAPPKKVIGADIETVSNIFGGAELLG